MTGCRLSRTERPTAAISDRFSPARTTVVQRCSCGQAAHSGGECDECRRQMEGASRSSEAGGHGRHTDLTQVPPRSGLAIGAPDDAFEREADSVAEQIVQREPEDTGAAMQSSSARPSPKRVTHPRRDERIPIMRKGLDGASCESARSGDESVEEEEREGANAPVRAKAEGRLGSADRSLEKSLSSSRGEGSPLAPDTRAFMESRFGEDLSSVRVHTNQRASAMNERLNSAAFTSGRDVYFRSGRYDTSSRAGNRLIAHELTHVIQQRRGIAAVQTGTGAEPVQHYIQRFSLRGFPKAEEAAMRAAIPKAIAKVKACSKLSWYGKRDIPIALNMSRYDYVPDLGLCGWTFPTSWYIEVGEKAFDSGRCCDLEATLAHEASHTVFYTEGRARTMECNCFGCSC